MVRAAPRLAGKIPSCGWSEPDLRSDSRAVACRCFCGRAEAVRSLVACYCELNLRSGPSQIVSEKV